nr:Fe(3+)-hydroxamate ABC transporter permease FhuB [Vibrio tetraodonis]
MIGLKVSMIGFLFGVLLVWLIQITVPYAKGWSILLDVLFNYDESNYQHLVTYLTYLPRLAMAVICGFALGVAGCVMQFMLRNPIASPTTLGVSSGAELGMVLGILLLPTNNVIPNFLPAFFGGCLATVLVFLLSAKRGFSPLHMVLSGMVVSLFLGALNTMLLLLNEQQLTSVFVWGAGVLNQNGWSGVTTLIPLVMLPILCLLVLQRPLSALQLGDRVGSSLGINIKQIKLVSLTLTILVVSAVTSEAGLIGFVGIVAPAIARFLRVRILQWQLFVSGVIGSLMLLFADLIIQLLSGPSGDLLPTGAMTALLGAPFLLWLLQRKFLQSELKVRDQVVEHYYHRSVARVVSGLVLTLTIAIVIALLVGRNQLGWSLDFSISLFQLRFPRVFAALLAGVGLALAGCIIQRISNNSMASPEILGISSGAAFALVVGAILGIAIERYEQMLIGAFGAAISTGFVWFFGRKHNFSPSQTLLTGIALSASLDSALRIAIALGQDNALALIAWLSGSTYLVASNDIEFLLMGMVLLGSTALLVSRWIDLISIGEIMAGSVGLECRKARLLLLALVASITTLCTIVIGPLSFVGLLAPHMAKTLSQYQARNQLVSAALIGATIMVIADWVGRTLWFPWQFPAGLLASLLGGVYFLYLMSK